MMKSLLSVVLTSILISNCTTTSYPVESAAEINPDETTTIASSEASSNEALGVIAVSVDEGSAGNFTFSVTVASDETGCDQYANWWEVIFEDGTLLYRRILAHSHINEQPFTRSGNGPLALDQDTIIIVRAHMHPTGYLPQAMQGTVSSGFEPITLPANFATDLAEAEPLPTGCAF